ncbi:hypothetical protein F4803DRAFT_503797 [Xylaria telfairii]|nr:hypothetical protein F4803DRAFT_503797 [Xylaria telfairii]
MLLDRVLAIGMTFRLAWADENAGFDVPGPPDDSVESPTYHIGDIVLIAWHMNFTDALLKLVYTPNDHTSTSSYIISEPTNKTSYQWTVTTLGLNSRTSNPEFYFSVYESGAEDASFISHYIFIITSDSNSSNPPSSNPTPTTTDPSSTPISTTTTTPTGTPTSAAIPEDTKKGSQGISGGVIAGIAVGSVAATLIVAGLAGWCLWVTLIKKKRIGNDTLRDRETVEQRQLSQEQYVDPGYPHSRSHKVELPNNEISELEGRPRPF